MASTSSTDWAASPRTLSHAGTATFRAHGFSATFRFAVTIGPVSTTTAGETPPYVKIDFPVLGTASVTNNKNPDDLSDEEALELAVKEVRAARAERRRGK
jgi:hypothetical protein